MFEQIILPQIEITRHHLNELRGHGGTGKTAEALNDALTELAAAIEVLNASVQEMRKAEARVHQAELELNALRSRLVDVLEFIPDPYLYTDANALVLDCNRVAESLLAVPRPVIIGKPLVNFVELSERSTFRARLSSVRANDLTPDWKLELQPRVGRAVSVIARVAADRDSIGKTRHLRWLFRVQRGTPV